MTAPEPHKFEITMLCADEDVPFFLKSMERFLDIITIREIKQPEQIDLLEVLRDWREWMFMQACTCEQVWLEEIKIIQELRTNPVVVIERLKQEGVMK